MSVDVPHQGTIGPALAACRPHHHQRFHNVRGMSDSAFRALYLTEQRKYCDILLCAETNCPTPLDERSWGQDWPRGRGSFTAWSSASPYANCRGMAMFVSDSVDFKNPRVIVGRRPGYPDDPDVAPDPTGRIIAVHATVAGRTTNIIGFHADNQNDPSRHISADENQVRSLLRLKEVVASMPPADDTILLTDANHPANPTLDQWRADGPTRQPYPRGSLAMATLTRDLGLSDAFRSLHPLSCEYTRTTFSSNTASGTRAASTKNRLDYTYVSSHLLAGAAGASVHKVLHVVPSSDQLSSLRTLQTSHQTTKRA